MADLSVEAFYKYREKNPGSKNAKAYEVWKGGGGKDREGYVWVENKKKRKKQQNQKNEKKTLNLFFRRAQNPHLILLKFL